MRLDCSGEQGNLAETAKNVKCSFFFFLMHQNVVNINKKICKTGDLMANTLVRLKHAGAGKSK